MAADVSHSSSAAAAVRPASVLRDAAEMWHFARKNGIERDLKRLHRPIPARSVGAAAIDWMLILLAAVASLAARRTRSA